MSDFDEVFGDVDFDEIEDELNDESLEFATLIPIGGRRVLLPITRNEAGEVIPQTIFEAAAAANLTMPTNTQFYVDGSPVGGDTHITDGMQITAVGNVKGG
jgi:hypothetical protein